MTILLIVWVIINFFRGFRGTDTNDFSYFLPSSRVNIISDGTIVYKHIVTLHAQCSTNIAKWPFDSHKCSFFIGSPLYTNNYVNYSLPENKIVSKLKYFK